MSAQNLLRFALIIIVAHFGIRALESAGGVINAARVSAEQQVCDGL